MSTTKNKCIFNDSWLIDPRFSLWIKKSNNKSKAYCNFCQKDFDISNMGIAALSSHALGKKHKDIQSLRESNVGALFYPKKSPTEHESTSAAKPKVKTVESMMIPASALKAEILWTLKVATSHYSLRSCLGLNEIFKAMFVDSAIAKSFQLNKTSSILFLLLILRIFF